MARLRKIRWMLHRFGQVEEPRRKLAAEAAFWLLLARLALIFVPFSILARHLGSFRSPADARALQGRTMISRDEVRLAVEVGWAVTRVAHHLPFEAKCLPQAMAARIMLKRRGVASVMHFGAAKGRDKPIDAHAWLDAAGIEVTGYPVAEGFAEIACFV